MAYPETIWKNTPSIDTPISADNLNKMEQGIGTADTNASSALTNIFSLANAISQFEDMANTTEAGYFQASNGEFVSNGSWIARVYPKSAADVIKTNGTYFNNVAPVLLLYNGTPSSSTFIGYANPSWYSGTSLDTTSNDEFLIPKEAQYFVINSRKDNNDPYGTVVGYTYGNTVQILNDEVPKAIEDIEYLTREAGFYQDKNLTISNSFYDCRVGSSATPTANNNFRSALVPVNEGEVYRVSGNVIAYANGVTALIVFINTSGTTVIGNAFPEKVAAQTIVNQLITIPSGCGYIGITSHKSGEPKVSSLSNTDNNVWDLITSQVSYRYKVTVSSGEVEVKTDEGIEYYFKPLLANNLYQLYKWKIGSNEYVHATDIIAPYHTLNAVNNANGDRTGQSSWTGGCHGYDGNFTGTTATAETLSAKLYIDGVEKSVSTDAEYSCNNITFVTVNGIQGNNTCKSDGSGRVVLQETVSYNFDGNRIKLSNIIKPLEDVTLYRYYGMQLAAYSNYYVLGELKKTESSTITYRPEMIAGYDSYTQVGMKMKKIGIGAYTENDTTRKGIISGGKGYYCPINENSDVWYANEEHYFVGEYIFGESLEY